MSTQFRPTLWPCVVIPPPKLRPMPDVEVVGDWIIWSALSVIRGRGVEPQELPGGFYLREFAEVDASDLDAVAGLVRQHGPLFNLDGDELDPEARMWREDLPSLSDDLGEEYTYFEGYHCRDIEIHLTQHQDAVKTWLALQSEGGLEGLVESEVDAGYLARFNADNSDDPPETLDGLRAMVAETRPGHLTDVLNGALKVFSPGIGGPDTRHATIYSVSLLQLYNDMVEGVSVRYCANQPCGKPYVRQRGRAEYGQNRTEGTKYCTRECARAQAQRELRRRRRSQRP